MDAITSATISSRAFLFAVRNAFYAFTTKIIAPINITNNVVDSLHHADNDTINKTNNVRLKGDIQ